MKRHVTITIDVKLHEEMRRYCEKYGYKFSTYVSLLISDALKTRGLWPHGKK